MDSDQGTQALRAERTATGPGLRVLVGRRIASLRRSTRPRLSQGALAGRVGISLSYLSKLETGAKDLPLTLAARIAQQLKVPLAALVSEADARETEECHRVCPRLCRMVQDAGYPVEWVGEGLEAILKVILAFAGSRWR